MSEETHRGNLVLDVATRFPKLQGKLRAIFRIKKGCPPSMKFHHKCEECKPMGKQRAMVTWYDSCFDERGSQLKYVSFS